MDVQGDNRIGRQELHEYFQRGGLEDNDTRMALVEELFTACDDD